VLLLSLSLPAIPTTLFHILSKATRGTVVGAGAAVAGLSSLLSAGWSRQPEHLLSVLCGSDVRSDGLYQVHVGFRLARISKTISPGTLSHIQHHLAGRYADAGGSTTFC